MSLDVSDVLLFAWVGRFVGKASADSQHWHEAGSKVIEIALILYITFMPKKLCYRGFLCVFYIFTFITVKQLLPLSVKK